MTGAQADETAVAFRFNHRIKQAVIVIAQCHESERLEYASGRRSHWAQHFCHALHVAGVRLECDLDEIAVGERPGQM